MATLIDEYKREACRMKPVTAKEAAADWSAIVDWWLVGRSLFEEVFLNEVGKAPSKAPVDDLLGAAIPKSLGDLQRKEVDDAYYAAHATLFLQEMDAIISRVPRDSPDVEAALVFGNVLRFVNQVLFDSVVLLEHWAERSRKVPGVFGVGKNEVEHLHTFFFGAQQTIYGHGSFQLSFVENHSDLVIGSIRQAIEIRLRRAFGIYGRVSDSAGAFEPIPISALFEAIRPFEARIFSEVPFSILRRVNGWANMYMHGALKLPVWTAPRVLDRLKPLMLGQGRRAGDGLRISRAAFDGVRQALKDKYDSTSSPIGLLLEAHCEAVIES
ncbi:hypothetical protein E5A73_09985 [Sphingomonas gei]|uniref:Uncharacterized protein n=1 Tax=Sphingomonas gei TaxID=1395960 RepID=A0A4S1XA83_9SPHN|nr:hypothetical protein [Sphingomonas gei]TGX53189.1 hypothetical protein E5A73_09985 [Sphingomonas gei]